MDNTFQEFMNNSSPANKHIVKELGLVRGIVACKVIYASNLKDKVCRMGIKRMADELGISKSTVSRTLELLIKDNYIERKQEATDTDAAHYCATDKLFSLIPGVAQRNTPVAVRNTPVAQCNQDKSQIRIDNNTIGKPDGLPPAIPDKQLPVKKAKQPTPQTDQLPQPKKELFTYFADYTKLAPPVNRSDVGFWYQRIGEIYVISHQDLPTARRLIKQAVDKLRGDDLTISDPGSLVKTIRALAANGGVGKVRMSAV